MHYKMHGMVIALLYAEMMKVRKEFKEGKMEKSGGCPLPSNLVKQKAMEI